MTPTLGACALPSPARRRLLGGALLAAAGLPALARAARLQRPTLLRVVPPAYRAAALAARVPPRLLYGIALQESAMGFGEHVLPWLWTLNIRGTPHRYATYADAVATLSQTVDIRRIRNVDCGPMQVNWGYHAATLGSFARALEPRANLAVGAALLAGHYRDTGDWYLATGRYHNPADGARARAYANGVFARLDHLREAA
jgi:hypothetical protein